jgi:hypothetical protein
VGQEQGVSKDNASIKATMMMMTKLERTLMTKERDGNLIPLLVLLGGIGTNDGGSGVFDNDNAEYNNAGPRGGGPESMIDDKYD